MSVIDISGVLTLYDISGTEAVQLELEAGEAIRMLTPGGGGMGR